MPDNYQHELYVHRENLFEKIQDWIQPSFDGYRLWSLIGTTGIGKSWFIADTYRHLSQEPNYLPIWLDLSQGAVFPDLGDRAPEAGQPFPNCQTEDGRAQWLKNEINRTKETYPDVSDYNSTVSFSSMFRKFVEDLCQYCGRQVPILLVDGYDEVALLADRDYLQEHIIAAFLGQQCTRILLARRDENAVTHHYLRWNETLVAVTPFKSEQSDDQINRRKQKLLQEDKPEKFVAQVAQAVLPYKSNHPFINSFLFGRAVQHATKDAPMIIVPDDFDDCVSAILVRAGIQLQVIDLLKRMVNNLPRRWTAIHLRDQLQVKVDNEQMDELFNAGIIYQNKGSSRYTMNDGIFELLSNADSVLERRDE